ncbi:GTPase IMAP family member 8-like [Oncorhynchus nerka]|uniref:GTPase IMAP family member 8-like n=1 Tax=Oncorhynchus nerka TaxID=8023 RepID=UPI0031B80441
MSESPTELRIVLLSKNGSDNSTVGKVILDRGAFVQSRCEKVRGQVEGRHIAVINTPDPHISHDKLSEELHWCATLSDPEPHVFLVMLQPEKFTQEEGDRIRTSSVTGPLTTQCVFTQDCASGESNDKKSTVGSMILQKEALKSAFILNYKQCESASGKVNGKSVTVVKTPDFFAPHLTVKSLMQEMERCKSLSAPGPHGVLLVLKPENFTEENRNTFKLILSIFGKEAFKYSMVIITHEGVAGNPHLSQMIEECGGRHHDMYKQGSDHNVLTEKIEKMVEENEWRYLTSNEDTTLDTMTPKAQRLNVVLCGRRGAGKTSIANVILGQTESSPKSSSSVCVKREGEVCGRPVTLIELPALYRTHLTQEEVMCETFHCVSLCDSGVNVFLLVVPLGPITDEDKGELETIQKILSSRVNDFVMVLF